MNPNRVVTRFAPSPTGFLHIGSVRTALYAWLYARKHQGKFILRIEDTDKEREVEGAIEHIVESLQWLGLSYDEGPILQSKRLNIYEKYARELIEKGYAYPDPYTEEELEDLRKDAEEKHEAFLYRNHRPTDTQPWNGTQPLRFRVPEIKRYAWHDLVRGDLSAGEEALDDFILMKSDGYPTYNFAHIVDDIEMGVTHIMRGEEFISSTPRFLSLYEALGVTPPLMASMPVILGPDGNKKLSKRDGAKSILDYKKEGYLSEGLLNFLALLGWSPGDNREVMSIPELIEAFDFKGIQKGGARLDEQKLRWINHEHIKKYAPQEFLAILTAYLQTEGFAIPEHLEKITPLLQARYQTLSEMAKSLTDGEFDFLASEPQVDVDLVIKNSDRAIVIKHLTHVRDLLQSLPEDAFTSSVLREHIFPYADAEGRGAVLWPLRVALSGKEKSPDPFALLEILGKGESEMRIDNVLQQL